MKTNSLVGGGGEDGGHSVSEHCSSLSEKSKKPEVPFGSILLLETDKDMPTYRYKVNHLVGEILQLT